MKILLTGGAGFIGSHVADAYLANGHEVVILDNLSTGNLENIPQKAALYHADITDPNEVEKIFQTEKPDVLNHHAAQINVRASVSDPLSDAKINILGGLNLLSSAQKNNVQKVIFSSTGGAIYGETENIPTPENYAEKPLSPYGISKLSFEKYIDFYSRIYKIPYVILRYANVYGPRQNSRGEAGVVSIFCERILQGEPLIINGDGKQTRDFIFVKDIAKANILATESNENNKIFNIGNGKETSVHMIFEEIQKCFSKKNIQKKYAPALEGEVSRSCLDATLAKSRLSWKAEVQLSEGIHQTVEYFRGK